MSAPKSSGHVYAHGLSGPTLIENAFPSQYDVIVAQNKFFCESHCLMNIEGFGSLVLLLSSGLSVLAKGFALENCPMPSLRPPYALPPHLHLLSKDPHSYKIGPTCTPQPPPLPPCPVHSTPANMFSLSWPQKCQTVTQRQALPPCCPLPPASFCWNHLLPSLGCLFLSQLG